MRKILLGLAATAVVATPLAAATAANAEVVSSASDCVPVKHVNAWTETLYKYVPFKNVSDGPTQWDTVFAKVGTHKTWTVKGKPVEYVRDSKTSAVSHAAIEGVTCSVTLPEHFAGEGTYSVIVPFVTGVDTFLYGVQGYDQGVAITHDVTVTKAMAGQFWIGHEAQPGYAIANPNTAQWHIDFAFAHSTHATGDVNWAVHTDANGDFTGNVVFDADANGGTLHMTNSLDMWLTGTVTPGTYAQNADGSVSFDGTLTGGDARYNGGTGYFHAKVIDNGTSGDKIVVFVNEDVVPDFYADVTSGNLTVF
jgi:hypothetical protein